MESGTEMANLSLDIDQRLPSGKSKSSEHVGTRARMPKEMLEQVFGEDRQVHITDRERKRTKGRIQYSSILLQRRSCTSINGGIQQKAY